jgi:hypothetical protein
LTCVNEGIACVTANLVELAELEKEERRKLEARWALTDWDCENSIPIAVLQQQRNQLIVEATKQ